MPSVSSKQAHLFGLALAIKRGKHVKRKSPQAMRLARTLSDKTLGEFTRVKK